MLERLIHEPQAREIEQPLLTLSNLNKINLIEFNLSIQRSSEARSVFYVKYSKDMIKAPHCLMHKLL